MGLKVLFGCYKDIGGGIEPQKLRCPLVGQVVRDNKDGFMAQSQPLAFHGCSDHFKGFARAHFVCKKCIAAVKNVCNGVSLMLPQSDFRVHTGENDMTSIILAGTGAVHFLVVLTYQRLAAFRVFPNPILKSVLDKLLFLRGKSGFLGIQHTALSAVRIFHGVINTNVTEIQRILK